MPAIAMDHFTILTEDVSATVAFYGDILGLEPGPRPPFDFPGAWLYGDGRPILHVVGGRPLPQDPQGVLDHMAFTATGLKETLRRLDARGVSYDLRQLPGGGLWQLFFLDPSGARVELDFRGEETAPEGWQE
ncbi:glyoxalase [Aliidongia dinghuensis]|uniref:Glyoxalase n=1 Tax=Aliidongia dinghuensis TaxID=1867774 RepID=A0A8J2YTY7_9PROT|nr:VOC family protein [Aliidongia dinghuensis]GGF19267.1 glyoxalase [Aliidongia dinghuensis]